MSIGFLYQLSLSDGVVIVPTIENVKELCILGCFSYFFRAKSATTNNHRTGLVIYHIKALSVVIGPFQPPVSRKTGL